MKIYRVIEDGIYSTLQPLEIEQWKYDEELERMEAHGVDFKEGDGFYIMGYISFHTYTKAKKYLLDYLRERKKEYAQAIKDISKKKKEHFK